MRGKFVEPQRTQRTQRAQRVTKGRLLIKNLRILCGNNTLCMLYFLLYFKKNRYRGRLSYVESIERGFTFGIAPKVTKGLALSLQKEKSQAIFLKSVNSLRSDSTDFFTEYRPAFLLWNAFSGKGRGLTGVTWGAMVPPYGCTISLMIHF